MKRLALAALVAGLISGCASAPANAGTLADVAIVDRATGERLPLHAHAGKLYVVGTPGSRYAVEIANRTAGRILAVVSVDGVNAITGETAAPGQSGYVLAPGQRYEIAGWRKNMGEVAQFYFTRLADSYAARTDRPANAGVIGVAVFREWAPPRPAASLAPDARADGLAGEAAAEAPAAASAAPREAKRALESGERLGTGHGERERSEATYTTFRRASAHPAETITIYYDRRENLVARGVIPGVPPLGTPDPFPGGRFVPDPRS